MLQGKTVLLTGGTGSFGKGFVKEIIQKNEVKKLIVFSRDELKQFEMQSEFNSPKLRYLLGDVRDFQRLRQISKDVDIIVHAAAIKQIAAAEFNPIEAIKTNIIGAENIVNAAIENKVSKVIALSTDKAANPANLYGATKLCSDKLFIAGNLLAGASGVKFSVVRYGNVLGSRGSVVPFFKEHSKEGFLPITDERMTRFWLSIDQGVKFVLDSLKNMQGGEIFVPKIPSFKVIDVAKVISPDLPVKIIGIRPGEKLHEIMITQDDAAYTLEFENYFVILAPFLLDSEFYKSNGKKVAKDFSFDSQNNFNWFTPESFRNILSKAGLLK